MAVQQDDANETSVLGRVVGSIPRYREEATRLASRIRDSLPPVMLAHRIEAVERRLDSIEAKVDEILRRLEKH